MNQIEIKNLMIGIKSQEDNKFKYLIYNKMISPIIHQTSKGLKLYSHDRIVYKVNSH